VSALPQVWVQLLQYSGAPYDPLPVPQHSEVDAQVSPRALQEQVPLLQTSPAQQLPWPLPVQELPPVAQPQVPLLQTSPAQQLESLVHIRPPEGRQEMHLV
jgi:hypothetical protein